MCPVYSAVKEKCGDEVKIENHMGYPTPRIALSVGSFVCDVFTPSGVLDPA